jgi:hypothetical protein
MTRMRGAGCSLQTEIHFSEGNNNITVIDVIIRVAKNGPEILHVEQHAVCTNNTQCIRTTRSVYEPLRKSVQSDLHSPYSSVVLDRHTLSNELPQYNLCNHQCQISLKFVEYFRTRNWGDQKYISYITFRQKRRIQGFGGET